MTNRLTAFDAADYVKDKASIAEYLNARLLRLVPSALDPQPDLPSEIPAEAIGAQPKSNLERITEMRDITDQ